MTDAALSLQRIRRRLVAAELLAVSMRSLLAGSFAAVALIAVRLWRGEAPWSPWAVASVLAIFWGAGVVWTFLRRPSLERTALVIDRLGDTRDRFTTALALPAEPGERLTALAAAECARFVAKFDAVPLIPLRIPRQGLALVVPLAAAALLCWHYGLSQRIDPATLAAQKEIEQKAEELETLTRQIEQAAKELKSPELEKLAEAMREALERLQAATKEKDASARDALRELSELEAMIEKMEQKDPAEQLDKLAQQLRNQQQPPPGMEEQARQAAEQMRLSKEARAELEKAMEEARSAAQKQAADGTQSAEASEAMRRLAEALRQMAQQGRKQSGGRQMKNAQAQLQNIKFGRATGKTRPADAGEGPPTAMIDPNAGRGEAEKGQAMLNLPTGQPGSEEGVGTTDSPFGKESALPKAQGKADQLTSVLGEGESLTDLVPAAGDTSKSTQRYRDLYKAIAGASEDAVDQENIPIASRFFVKRYFQNIRPKE